MKSLCKKFLETCSVLVTTTSFIRGSKGCNFSLAVKILIFERFMAFSLMSLLLFFYGMSTITVPGKEDSWTEVTSFDDV